MTRKADARGREGTKLSISMGRKSETNASTPAYSLGGARMVWTIIATNQLRASRPERTADQNPSFTTALGSAGA
jgi:hypothetical protein